MSFSAGIKLNRIFSFFLTMLLGLLFFISVKAVDGYRHSIKQGKLVKSVVHEHSSFVDQRYFSQTSAIKQIGWPDDFPALAAWLITEWTQAPSDPLMISRKLASIAKKHTYSPIMRTSLQRWMQTLSEVAAFNEKSGLSTPEALFFEGRLRYFRAEGYKKIGRGYDAAVLYLWATNLLVSYIEKAPFAKDVPQALFLLGASFVRLQHALPVDFRDHRILSLCSELYPYSIWSKRANTYCQDEMGNGV